MINLTTRYLDLSLNNPIIVSSSALTNEPEKIRRLEELGAGAVVVKSLFEEQIQYEAGHLTEDLSYPEAQDYIMRYMKSNSLNEYLQLIETAKKRIKIPLIASISCYSVSEWVGFAKDIENAGADALELNVYYLLTDKNIASDKHEQLYYDLVTKIREKSKIPVSVKIGTHFTNLVRLVNNLYLRGSGGVVLFNRFYAPDIDIDHMKMTTASVFSSPSEIRDSLRWVGILSGQVEKIDISASTGIHDSEGAIKQILAGAKTVQVCSALYKNGIEHLPVIIKGMQDWMAKQRFRSIDDFRGKLSYRNIPDPTIYERSQFMKYYSSYQ